MTRLAKAPSAFIHGRNSGRFAVLALAMACALLLSNATGASAATKYYDSTIGTTSGLNTAIPPTPAGTAFGATFGSANGGVGDIAVNDPEVNDGNGTEGWVYVVDRGNNRIQAFDANKNFKWAIGGDVVAPFVNEAQVLTVSATAGKFKLEFNGTPTAVELDWNVTAANLDNALDTLVGGVDTNVIVTGSPATVSNPVGRYAIQFAGTFGAANQPQVAVLPGTPALTGTAAVTTVADGSATAGTGNVALNEKQTIALDPAINGGTFTLGFSGTAPTTTTTLPFNASAAELETALAALGGIGGAANLDVTGAAGGPWTVEFTGALADRNVPLITANTAAASVAIGTQLTCSSTTESDNTSFQWLANGAPASGTGATAATYTVDASDAGKAVQCRIVKSNASNGAGTTQVSNPAAIASPPPGAAIPTAPTGSIAAPSGAVAAGNNLTCSAAPGTGSTQWGNSPTSYTYTWLKNGSQVLETEVKAGASTSDTYTLTAPDVASPAVFQCLIAATNANGSVSKASQSKATPTAPSPAAPGGNTASPQVSVAAPGATIATDPDSIALEKCTVASQCQVAQSGPRGGLFDVAQGIDIDQDSGHFFVNERTPNARVQQFEADGDFIRAFGWDVVQSGPGNSGSFETCNAAEADVCKSGATAQHFGTANPGQFGSYLAPSGNESRGLAVAPLGAPNAGQLYVADPGSCRVQSFTVPAAPEDAVLAGTPFGLPSTSGGAPNDDDAFCSKSLGGSIDAKFPRDVAADRNGVVYASTTGGSNGGIIKRFDTAAFGGGAFEPDIAVGGGANQLGDGPAGVGGSVEAFEIDPDNDHLLLARSASLASMGIVELDLTENPSLVEPEHVVDRHLLTLGANSRALGIGGGRFFLSTSNNLTGTGAGERLLVFDEDGVDPDPIVSIEPAANVTATSADFEGNVDPVITTAFQTFYRWQLSKDGVNWTDLTTSVLVPPNGFTKADVTHSVAGLDANTLYRIRIRTDRNPVAGFAFSATQLFLTDPAPPVVETRPAQHVTDESAQLIGNLNPGGIAGTYWFEWGAGSLDKTAPVVPAATNGGHYRLVSETLTGLTPGTAHEYRLCAENSLSGGKVCGATRTFTSLPAATSPLPGRTYEMVTAADKASRRASALTAPGYDYSRLQSGFPAADGSPAFMQSFFAQPNDPEAGYGSAAFPASFEVRHRQPDRWSGEAIFNVAPQGPTSVQPFGTSGPWSADLQTSVWGSAASMVGEGLLAVRKLGDNGGPRGAGWYPWLDSSWTSDGDAFLTTFWNAQLDDSGERIVAQSGGEETRLFRDIVPTDDTLSPEGLTPPQTSGHAVFLSDPAHEWRPADLLNECTGSGATATLIPRRSDSGTPSGPSGSVTFSASSVFYSGGSNSITLFGSAAGVKVGHFVSGPNIPSGARVVTVASEAFTISVAATGPSGSGPVTVGQSPAALADDTISTRSCGEGSPTDVRGANFSPSGSNPLAGSGAMVMSENGTRVFFLSPDPTSAEATCATADTDTAAGTLCPPQLFVRQFDDEGNPTVRWISRPEDELFFDGLGEPQMNPAAALGSGVAFEGASRDGRYVFFRTDAPLTDDDPNGTLDLLKEASPHSWDLYRYDLGPDNDEDPAAGDPGDRLVRVSAGPDPIGAPADPNTNCAAVPTAGLDAGKVCVGALEITGPDVGQSDGTPNGAGGALRFLSDEGSKAYFVTAASIPGAENDPPAGGSTVPTAANQQVNMTSRNLYLYDAAKSGAGAYEFIARLPFSRTDSIAACAGYGARSQGPLAVTGGMALLVSGRQNCVHGSGAGDGILFASPAQLTEDDFDSASDLYLYDADLDSLTRISAPGIADQPYACVISFSGTVAERCNADLGFATAETHRSAGLAGERHWNIAQDEQGNFTDVYFQSRLPLVESDENAPDTETFGGMDVYRYHRSNGRLSLVSPGTTDGGPAFYQGNSLYGQDVYFKTEERISPWEIDASDPDTYNSTTRDPLPDPPVAPVACNVLASSCQGAPPAAPPANGAASAALKGEGNVTEAPKRKRCSKGKVRRGKRCVAKQRNRNKRAANADRRANR